MNETKRTWLQYNFWIRIAGWLGLMAMRCTDPPAGLDALDRGSDDSTNFCTVDGVCTKQPVLGDVNFSAFYAASDTDVWVGGSQGILWHYNGKRWLLTHEEEGVTWTGIYGINDQDAWAVGQVKLAGDVVSKLSHWDGASWKPYKGICFEDESKWCNSIPKFLALNSIGGRGNQVWVFGERLVERLGSVYHLSEGHPSLELLADFKIQSGWVGPKGEVWIVGDSVVERRDPVTGIWKKREFSEAPKNPQFTSLSGNSKGDVLLGSQKLGTLAYHPHDQALTTWLLNYPLSGEKGVLSITAGQDDGFWILRSDGSSSEVQKCEAGADPTIRSACMVTLLDPQKSLNSLFGGPALSSVWGVGDQGTVLQNLVEGQVKGHSSPAWIRQLDDQKEPYPAILLGDGAGTLWANNGIISATYDHDRWNTEEHFPPIFPGPDYLVGLTLLDQTPMSVWTSLTKTTIRTFANSDIPGSSVIDSFHCNAVRFWHGKLWAVGNQGKVKVFEQDGTRLGLKVVKTIQCETSRHTFENLLALDADTYYRSSPLMIVGKNGAFFEILEDENSCLEVTPAPNTTEDLRGIAVYQTHHRLIGGTKVFLDDRTNTGAYEEQDLGVRLNAILKTQDDALYVVGDQGSIFYRGSNDFQPQLSGTDANLLSMWEDSKTGSIWILGEGGVLLKQ